MRSWVEVSLGRIRENYRAVRGVLEGRAEVMAVVKADAYRHGAIEISRVLESEGVRWLAVSNTSEGIALRQAGIAARILVMADFLSEDRAALETFSLTPVVHSLEDLAAVRVPYHLKIDSGMGRLGTRAEPAEILRAVLAAPAPLEGLMTHFASSANYESRQTEEQIARFAAVLAAFRARGVAPAYVHLSSTIPVAYRRTEAWGNLVRPGHAIYGYVSPGRGPAPPPALEVRPALSWKAAVLSVKDIEAGALVGYGGIYRAPRAMRIAVLAAGYADGIPHRLSNRGKVIARGKLVPIIGAVSMDLTTIDATDTDLRAGDAVTLLGSEGSVSIDAQQIARWAGTISYSVLCGIHARVTRVYVD
ncbi:MAG TPA: alanine racemase [Bryobacteraceae bacterium]|jgi:alanine racemase|nr:alanine racemase [Bryobacteraceae bacterium]